MRAFAVIVASCIVVGAGCSPDASEKIVPPGSERAALVRKATSLVEGIQQEVRAKLNSPRPVVYENEYEGYEDSEYEEEPVAAPAPVPAPAAAPARIPQRLDPAYVNASSVLPSSKGFNDARNATDRNPETWWGEGVSGDGIGEWLEYSWSGRAEVSEIRLITGYQKELQDKFGDRWPLNNRIRRVSVVIPGATSFDAALDDRKGFQTIVVPPGNFGTSVRIVIMDVYPGYNAAGKHIEDSGISEIEVLGLR